MRAQGQMMVLREQNHVASEPNHVDVSRNRHLVKCLPVTRKSGLTLQSFQGVPGGKPCGSTK